MQETVVQTVNTCYMVRHQQTHLHVAYSFLCYSAKIWLIRLVTYSAAETIPMRAVPKLRETPVND